MTDVQAEPAVPGVDSLLCFALYSTLHAVGKAYAEILPDLDLTYPQYVVMLVLWERDRLAVKEIGARTHLDSGTLTPLLKRLERAGLVTRARSTADERQVVIGLTPKGAGLKEAASTVPGRMACAMGRSPDELAALRDDLLRLRSTLVDSRRTTDSAAGRGLAQA